MCGRVLLESEFKEILIRYNIYGAGEREFKRGEGFPGDNIPAIFNDDGLQVDLFNWGFILNGKRIINARAETVLEKPFFKRHFIFNRCIVPVNAFFEWRNEGNKKIKYKISLKDDKIMSLAGMYGVFKDKDGSVKKCITVLTTEPNSEVKDIHNRMPVILVREKEQLYLRKEFNIEILDLLKPIDEGRLVIENVDKNEYENISFF
ncbi:SOS response-associated peptidase [Thermobrachium celere]|uniref:SOS response-associated peptidase n=1 Tax=Thermobrachium celere TaxID=53422 RepID=UPI00194560FF|nr:SOS response-associated peptidase [Thermobrachium celere]GFR36429.1 DUF159 family protein [Thermobrachium celere]